MPGCRPRRWPNWGFAWRPPSATCIATGWLHLDLKPSNVIAECGRAKLIDMSVERPPGRAHAGIGTLYYMAPEQARGGELGPAVGRVGHRGGAVRGGQAGEPAFDDPDADELDGAEDSDTPSEAGDGGGGRRAVRVGRRADVRAL